MWVPRASPGYLTLLDEVVVVTEAMLGGCVPSGGVEPVVHDLFAGRCEESPGSLADVLVLLGLTRRTLAVGVLGVAARWAHRVVVTVEHRASDVPASLVIIVLFRVALEVGSTRASAELRRVVGKSRGGRDGGGRARMDDYALVLVLVTFSLATTARATVVASSVAVVVGLAVASSVAVTVGLAVASSVGVTVSLSSLETAVRYSGASILLPGSSCPPGVTVPVLSGVPAADLTGWAGMDGTLPRESRVSRAVATGNLASRRAHGDLGAVGFGRNMTDAAHALTGLVASTTAVVGTTVASAVVGTTVASSILSTTLSILSLHSASGLSSLASRRRAAVAVLVLLAAVVLASCGSSSSIAASVIARVVSGITALGITASGITASPALPDRLHGISDVPSYTSEVAEMGVLLRASAVSDVRVRLRGCAAS